MKKLDSYNPKKFLIKYFERLFFFIFRLQSLRSEALDWFDHSEVISNQTFYILNFNFRSISGLQTLRSEALDGFDHNTLETINLSWNELIQVPEVVLKLVKLRHLDLSHNKIFSLPPGSSFNSLNALATLKLSGNRYVSYSSWNLNIEFF